MMMGGNDDIIPEKTRAMADAPPPPPSTPGSPLKSPTTPLMPRGGGGGDNADGTGSPADTGDTTPSGSSANPLLSPPLLLEIEEGTPAAEALKANADVRVSKLRKVGRSTRLQAGVRALKSAARTASGQPGHAGDRRGAPAFVAPRGSTLQNVSMTQPNQQPPTIPEVDDEGDSEHGDPLRPRQVVPPRGSPKVSFQGDAVAAEGASVGDQSIDDDSASQDNRSITLDDSSTDRHMQHQPTPYTAATSPAVESLLLAQHPSTRHSIHHITHAALPAAVAAACRAGEDMDRKRATLVSNERSNSASKGLGADTAQRSPLKPLASLFKITDEDNASPSKGSPRPRPHRRSQSATLNNDKVFSHRRNQSVPNNDKVFSLPKPMPPPFRRTSMERNHQMPSEISVAETEKHANFRNDGMDHIEDLSDDDEEMLTTDITGGGRSDIQIKKHVDISPIVVEIPGSLPYELIEETKEEEITDEEAEGNREALMAKAKKSFSRKASKKNKHGLDEDMFHSVGPKQVRKWINKRRENEASKIQRSYVKGKVIDGQHELYTMSIAVMFGMRTSIGRTNEAMSQTAHNERRWLDNDDLMAVEKYEFPPRGSDMTPPHQLNHTFKFKDYSPLAFAYLRRMFGVNEYDFLLSVCGNANYINFQSNAKSGQFFFYSPDGKYMIKTMTNTESKFLRRILPHYFRHCSMNPNTLVAKFLGMYRVKLYHLKRNVKFVVMKSVYDTDKDLHEIFDVKGSTTGRDAPNDAVKKDNDIRRHLPDGAFILEPSLRNRVQQQVKSDCEWLKSMKIMDYSMLIGVHNIGHRYTRKQTTQLTPARVLSNDDGDGGSMSSYDASNATLDRYLNVDDDDSYLDGYHKKEKNSRVAYETSSTSDEAVRTVRVVKGSDHADDESSKASKKGTEALAEKAIQDMYWPFHRFYDIQGLRRMSPIRESLVAPVSKKEIEVKLDEKGEKTLVEMLFSPKAEVPMSSGSQNELPTFERPLSYRKDAGFMMDTTATGLPLKREKAGQPHVHEYCDGKIFYMGIIDILQQFNIRKRGEARYRRLGGKGWEAASCVHPSVYADRFVRFFDEYTEGPPRTANNDLPTENASVASDSASNSEMSLRVKNKIM